MYRFLNRRGTWDYVLFMNGGAGVVPLNPTQALVKNLSWGRPRILTGPSYRLKVSWLTKQFGFANPQCLVVAVKSSLLHMDSYPIPFGSFTCQAVIIGGFSIGILQSCQTNDPCSQIRDLHSQTNYQYSQINDAHSKVNDWHSQINYWLSQIDHWYGAVHKWCTPIAKCTINDISIWNNRSFLKTTSWGIISWEYEATPPINTWFGFEQRILFPSGSIVQDDVRTEDGGRDTALARSPHSIATILVRCLLSLSLWEGATEPGVPICHFKRGAKEVPGGF